MVPPAASILNTARMHLIGLHSSRAAGAVTSETAAFSAREQEIRALLKTTRVFLVVSQ